jgi:hypothetical protein
MKTLFRLVFLGFMLSGWGLAALSLHVIRTPTEIGLIPKDRLGIVDTYVDTRTWKIADAASHPLVVSRVLATGQVALLHHIGNGEDDSALQKQLADVVKHSRNHGTTTATALGALDFEQTSSAVQKWWAMR